MTRHAALFAIVCLLGVNGVAAQDAPPAGWTAGPVVGKLGTRATVSVPEGYFFLDRKATKTFLEENQNIPDGDELGIVLHVLENDDYWFAVFSYGETGHIDNSDRNDLDADDLLKTMREGNAEANAERKKRGWAALNLEGWHQPPYYDVATDNLTWATRLSSEGHPVVNHSVRLLGRTGLMSAQLVADPKTIDAATSEFNGVLQTYSFNEGYRYAEFRPGDKLAGYGLTALIAGGAGAAAVKTGLFKKLWKVIVLGIAALVGAARRLLNALLGRKDPPAEAAPAAGN